jgi:hypothetical protein
MKKNTNNSRKSKDQHHGTRTKFIFRLSVLVVGFAVFMGAGITGLKIPAFLDFPAAKPSDTETMMAVSYTENGDPFVLKMNMRYPRPVPRDDQVLVKVHMTSVNPAVSTKTDTSMNRKQSYFESTG